jgi:copper(I)-binding protein
MTLRNTTAEPVALTGASSPACEMMMLHRTEHSGGQERMVPVKRITIRAHGTFRFAPGAYHVMCMKPKMHVGETIPVRLRFADAPPLTTQFRVYGATGRPSGR